MLTGLTKAEGGVEEMLTLADKGGRGGLDPPGLAVIICEKPLRPTEFYIANLGCLKFRAELDTMLEMKTIY